MGLGTYLNEEVFGGARRKRQEQADNLAQQLLAKGDLQPEAINNVVNKWIDTGKMNIPTYQSKALPFDPEVPEGRTSREPVRLGKKKGLFTLDQGSGKITQIDTPDDMTDYEVKTIPPQKPVNNNKGHTFKIDRATGGSVDQGENGKTYNDYVYWDSSSGNKGSGKTPPDVELAKDTLKKYQAAVLKGEDIPDEFMDSVRSAADLLSIDMAEVQKDPSALDVLLGAASKATGGVVPAPKPKFGGTAPRFNGKDGKPLTKDLAQKFMQQATKALGPKAKPEDVKKKARALAKAQNYTF